MSKNNTRQEIPEHILQKCAEEAYHKVQFHYGHWNPIDISKEPPHIQKNVLGDVKAVLYRFATPADLHKRWSNRKLKQCGGNLGVVGDRYPTALYGFSDLTPDDQKGYEVFQSTVLQTYYSMHGQVKNYRSYDGVLTPAQVVNIWNSGTQEQLLVNTAKKVKTCDVGTTGTVTMRFENLQDALGFWSALVEVKRV